MDQQHQSRRRFLEQTVATAALLVAGTSSARNVLKGALPACSRYSGTRLELGGRVGDYLSGITEQWLKVAAASNPAMIEMFLDRDREPRREMVPWAGEFAGKHLVSSVQVWRTTADPKLKDCIHGFVKLLTTCQAEDGYLGPWPKEDRLTGRAPNTGPKGGETWDAWGHYHIMLGLLLWHEDTQDRAALECARRIGDLFCAKFEHARLVDTGSTEMNLAPIHSLCLLHRRTGERRYLDLALKICAEFAARSPEGKPLAGDYVNAALAGKEFFDMPKPRWESLHPIMGVAELHWITAEKEYRKAFEHIWWSIVKLDRHNNGGFSSGEQAQGNPYHKGAIETCCTIAWVAMSVEMLRMTGSSIVADEIELSTLNSVTGMHSPSGRWVTYNTPMDGTRKASAHDIVFQARAGSPELNCCSVNGARGFGMISDWALMADENRLFLNWYGPSTIRTRLASGRSVELVQRTEYPTGNKVSLGIRPSEETTFELNLRIPHWSRKTEVKLNGRAVGGVTAGDYLGLKRKWQVGDTIEIEFDFSLHFWAGEREYAGKACIYRGPLLLAYDRRLNEADPAQIPILDARSLFGVEVKTSTWLAPWLLLEFRSGDGHAVRLCDFGSAGVGGSPYRSWLEIRNAPSTPFSRSNPLRSARA